MSEKVIHLQGQPAIVDVVKELEQHVLDGAVTEAIVIYRFKDERRSNPHRTAYHWFGNSSIMCLGLARHAADLVADYIRDNWETEEERW